MSHYKTQTPRYMQALFSESGQNSSYTRNLPDPGGENQVVMLKSCFPNSALEGNPYDPPAPGNGLSVGNAKYTYNDLLNYFQTRPDKLFVVITAPPLIDSIYAKNARAFNTWLVQDWLRENNYTVGNVAVFDFYNVLTSPQNHHRFKNSNAEYINDQGGNTEYYPGEDDHPNQEGSRKATDEFVPLLNVFYHRWSSGAPAQPPVQQPPAVPTLPQGETPVEIPLAALSASNLIEDFEAESLPDKEGWVSYWEEGTQTSLKCQRESGMANSGNFGLHINNAIQANSWGTCSMFYHQVQDWRSASGLSLYVRAAQAAQVFDINVFKGNHENRETYLFTVESTPSMVEGWVQLEIPWDLLRRADCEANPGTPLIPDQVAGLSIGFNTLPDTPNNGEMWVDDITLMGPMIQASEPTQPSAEVTAPTAPEQLSPTAEEPVGGTEGRGRGFCPLSPAIGLLAARLVLLGRWRQR